MAGQKTISCTHVEDITPPTPPPVLVVTGIPSPSPDCRGYYYQTADYDGHPTYKRLDGSYTIWWLTGPNYWIISPGIEEYPPAYWHRSSPDVDGIFVADGTATGTPVAATIP